MSEPLCSFRARSSNGPVATASWHEGSGSISERAVPDETLPDGSTAVQAAAGWRSAEMVRGQGGAGGLFSPSP